MTWIDECVSQYYKWLRDKTHTKFDSETGWSRISTPFNGLFNDSIEIYAKEENGVILLSDDGITVENLELCGVSLSRSSKRKEWVDFIKRNYGISLSDSGELFTEATLDNFPQKKHNLICAVSEISSLEVTAQHTVESFFREDVRAMLDDLGLIYTPQFIAKGNTGIDFTFDFQIAGKGQETVIKTFNSLNKMNVPNFLFGWDDVKDARKKASGKDLHGLAIINDNKDINRDFLTAITSKGADYILWSEKDMQSNIDKLRMAS